MKRLIFCSNFSKKRILIVGKGPFTDLISFLLKKIDVNFTYVKVGNNCKIKTIDFFDDVYIPEILFSEFDIFAQNHSDIRFCCYFNEKVLPVINVLQFFEEICKKLLCIDTVLNFEAGYFENRENQILKKIIQSIFYIYGYPNVSFSENNILNILKKNFFSKNIKFKLNKFSEILNNAVATSNIEINYFENINTIERKRKKIIIDDKVFDYDIFFTDLLALLKNNQIIKLEKNIIEFKIDKDYTTEYFPEKIIFYDNNFLQMELIENNFQRKFQISSFNNINISFVYNFFKNYFPNLKEDDIIVEKNSKIIYENFVFKKELQPFNFTCKIMEIKNFLKNNLRRL